MKKVLVTGGAGSMGKEISIILADKGYMVRVFDIPQANFAGLEEKNIETIKGDIGNVESVSNAINDIDIVVHLAAILPPASEVNKELTMKVNVNGTNNIVDSIIAKGKDIRLIFTSTVATYGNTTNLEPPINVATIQKPNTNYSESKVLAEKYILSSGINYSILRVSGVVLAALLDPPAWPFTENQRVEFVFRDDVVSAIVAAVESENAASKILIVAGGKTWQMKGYEFVKEFLHVLDIPLEDAEYSKNSIYSDWYDTKDAQEILKYQKTSFPEFLKIFQNVVDEALG